MIEPIRVSHLRDGRSSSVDELVQVRGLAPHLHKQGSKRRRGVTPIQALKAALKALVLL